MKASSFASISIWLREGKYAPGDFEITSWLFLRALGVIYYAAFVSFGMQATGLIGDHGILPVSDFTTLVSSHLGIERYWQLPMVFWINTTDLFIQSVCVAGAIASLLITFNILPRISLLLAYILYLSLTNAGQTFMSFQWDYLLIDAGFLGFLLSIATRPGIFLLRWLIFRFIFLSGVVKIASGDATWRDLSALTYHFQTQPLPTPLAWYAHHLPFSILTCMTFITLFIELIFPFFIFYSRRMRFVAAFGILGLQTVIALTGNYNFFNLLVIAGCLALFDDAAFLRVLPQRLIAYLRERPAKPTSQLSFKIVGAAAIVIIFATSLQLVTFFGVRLSGPLTWINEALAPMHIINTYGPFAVMTTKREEIIIEGSDDHKNWKEYAFTYKPGDVMRRPPWNIPHQPRVDWQLWFAALESPYQNRWFLNFVRRLLENEPQVTSLLENNPFPHQPPKYIRALLYEYRFSSPEEKDKTGAWWDRSLTSVYMPAVSLK